MRQVPHFDLVEWLRLGMACFMLRLSRIGGVLREEGRSQMMKQCFVWFTCRKFGRGYSLYLVEWKVAKRLVTKLFDLPKIFQELG